MSYVNFTGAVSGYGQVCVSSASQLESFCQNLAIEMAKRPLYPSLLIAMSWILLGIYFIVKNSPNLYFKPLRLIYASAFLQLIYCVILIYNLMK